MDVAPKRQTTSRQKIAQLVRLLGTSERGERENAWRALVRAMAGAGVGWSDLGNWIECDEDKYSASELAEFAQIARAEGVEAGIRIGEARAGNTSNGNGLSLPRPAEMAEYCHERLGQLKDNQRDFVSDMYLITQRGVQLSPGRLGYLASIFIQIGGVSP
jgi:hypothetical protein